jgi:hypothetical protein
VIQIVVISNPDKLSGKLTKWATGSYAYHIAFVDTELSKMWDMNIIFRRRIWPHYRPECVRFYECPTLLTVEDLELELDTSTDVYGVLDYSFFALKKIFSMNKAPSFKGKICSEKVLDILVRHGWRNPFKSVPSPADFEKVLNPLKG